MIPALERAARRSVLPGWEAAPACGLKQLVSARPDAVHFNTQRYIRRDLLLHKCDPSHTITMAVVHPTRPLMQTPLFRRHTESLPLEERFRLSYERAKAIGQAYREL
jgi:hypothetical protein